MLSYFKRRAKEQKTALAERQSDPRLELTPVPQSYQSDTLICAAATNDYPKTQVLLESRANVDSQDENGDTPLILATMSNYQQIVSLLFKYKANPNVQNNNGITALIFSANMGYTTPDHIDTASTLIAHGADVNMRDEGQGTALMAAAAMGHAHIISMLLYHNANIDLQDDNGNTALMFAVINNHIDCINMLLKHSADVQLKNQSGQTALEIAVEMRKKETVRALLEAGAQPESEDKETDRKLKRYCAPLMAEINEARASSTSMVQSPPRKPSQ